MFPDMRQDPSAKVKTDFSRIMQVMDFTWDDLQANRDGLLSKRQQGKLVGCLASCGMMISLLSGASCSLITFGSMMASLMLGYSIKGGANNNQHNHSGFLIVVLCMLALISLVSLLYMGTILHRWQLSHDDVNLGKVNVVDGKVKNRLGDGHIRIDNIRLNFTNTACELLIENDRYYCVYYAPRTKIIVSVEP